MKKTYRVTGKKTLLDAKAKPYQVITISEIPQMCKNCKEYARRPSSAYCQHCADEHNRLDQS